MNRKLIVLIVASVLPAYAVAGKLDLKQDLGGLDLTVAAEPLDNPDVLKIANKSTKVVSCHGNFTGADYGGTVTVTIQPGKSTTVRIPATYTDLPRSGQLKCTEAKAK